MTVIESLKLKRRAIGVDVNPLATYVTEMQSKPIDLDVLRQASLEVGERARQEILSLYSTRCSNCGAKAVADWIEWNEQPRQIVRIKYDCLTCGATHEKAPNQEDTLLTRKIEKNFIPIVKQKRLWFPKTRIPLGDKTSSPLHHGTYYFHELFTRRNLLALSLLLNDD